MIELYTPEQWSKVFGYSVPTIAIDEGSGYIYNGADAHKFSPTPIGRIDMGQMAVYGGDYTSPFAQPIARLYRRGDTMEVYEMLGYDGKPLHFSQPLFYIRDHKIYKDNPALSILNTPDGYLRGGKSHPQPSAPSRPASSGSSFGGGGCLFGEILGPVVLVFGIGIFAYCVFILPRYVNYVCFGIGLLSLIGGILLRLFGRNRHRKYLFSGITYAFGGGFSLAVIYAFLNLIRNGPRLGSDLLADLSLLLMAIGWFLIGLQQPPQTKKT